MTASTLASSAHSKVNQALKNGEIVKPDKCSQCPSRSNLHAHHKDYNKPLEVEWLCASCHRRLHKRSKQKIAPDNHMKPIQIRPRLELYKQIEIAAKTDRRSVNNFILLVLEKAVSQLENAG